MSAGLGRASELAWEQSTAELRAAARWGAADPETIERTLGRLLPADPDSWLIEWTAAGGALWAAPDPYDLAGSHLAAASYYAAAIAHIGQTDGTVNERILWQRQRDCWDAAVDALGAQRLTIQFAQTGLPAYFFSGGPGRRPLIVIDHGGRVATSHAWIQGGAAAHARGYHWLTFDGPGRQAARRNLRLVLTPRWDTVIDAVLDAAGSRSDVDASRIALIGADHGALGAAQALTMTNRLAAAALLPGILDASEPLVNALPQAMRGPLLEGNRVHFDEELRLAALFAPDTASVCAERSVTTVICANRSSMSIAARSASGCDPSISRRSRLRSRSPLRMRRDRGPARPCGSPSSSGRPSIWASWPSAATRPSSGPGLGSEPTPRRVTPGYAWWGSAECLATRVGVAAGRAR